MELDYNNRFYPLGSIPETFSELKKTIEKALGINLDSSPSVGLRYTDVEGDQVQVHDQNDFDYLKLFHSNAKVVISVSASSQKEASDIEAHIAKQSPDNAWSARTTQNEDLDLENLVKSKGKENDVSKIKKMAEAQTGLISNIESSVDQIKSSLSSQNNEKESEKLAPKRVLQISHTNVKCDTCKKMPIVGRRFVCLVCENFDICEECEELNVHSKHPMIRFNTPGFTVNQSKVLQDSFGNSAGNGANQADSPQIRSNYALSKAGNKYHPQLITALLRKYEKESIHTFMKEIDALFK